MQSPMPDDWDGESTCRWAVCWPDSPQWKAVLYGLIEFPNQGRFWDFQTGDFLALRAAFKPSLDYNFNLKEVIMACGDTGLAEALEHIAAALQAQAAATLAAAQTVSVQTAGCCGEGSGGAGEHAPPLDPTVPGDPTVDDPPPGFDSWDQYFSNRCAVATDIINKARGSVANMKLINLIGLTLLSITPILIGLLLDPIPGDEIAVIGGVLLASVAFGTAILDSVLAAIDGHKDELICELYKNGTAGEAESRVEAKFYEVYDTDNPGVPYFYGAIQLFNSLIGSTQTNRLVTLNTAITLPEGDCSDCDEFEGCTDFNDGELHGYGPSDDCCIYAGGFPVFGLVTADLNAAQIHGQLDAVTYYGTLLSPSIPPYVIQEGDTLCLNISEDTTLGTANEYLELEVDGVWTDLGHATGSIIGIRVLSLDAFAGQTLTRWQIGWSALVPFNIYVTTIGLNCAEC